MEALTKVKKLNLRPEFLIPAKEKTPQAAGFPVCPPKNKTGNNRLMKEPQLKLLSNQAMDNQLS